MTDATATFYDVTSFGVRRFPFDECRRMVRRFTDVFLIGFAGLAAACALVATVFVAAAWMFRIALSTGPYLQAKSPVGLEAITLANRYPGLPPAAGLPHPAQALAKSADGLSFAAKWARTMLPAPAAKRVETVALQGPVEQLKKEPLPGPADASPGDAKPDVASHSESIQVAALPPPAVAGPASSHAVAPKREPDHAGGMPPARPPSAKRDTAKVASAPPSTSVKRAPQQQADDKSMPLPGPDSRTAVYDIAAHTVYLPNGERLEAHSGLGDKLDDPRYVRVKNRGPTPPNVYDLTLREQLFHGVRAIRLNPVDEGKMFGRDGMLAHTYMLGPNGQSNGCVSFRDYPKFLHAVVSGKVDRLVVVPSLGNKSWRTAGARRGPARRDADDDS